MIEEKLREIFEAFVGPRIEAGVAYRARVILQHADGTLDITPESKRAEKVLRTSTMTKVPIRYGAPAISAKVAAGAVVFVEFLEGDRSQPIVTGWETATVTEITVKADTVRLADGDMPLARRGDLVVVQLPTNAFPAANGWTPVPNPSPTAKAYGTIISGSAASKSK